MVNDDDTEQLRFDGILEHNEAVEAISVPFRTDDDVEEVEGNDFPTALADLLQGEEAAVSRIGWPDGVYIYVLEGGQMPPPPNISHVYEAGVVLDFGHSLCKSDEQDDQYPYTPTQEDIFAEDWYVL